MPSRGALAQVGRVNVADILRRSSAKFPARTAVDDGESLLTYSQLQSAVNRVANGLLGTGLRSQDFVAIMTGNRMAAIETYLACARGGLVALPLSPGLGLNELTHIFAQARPRAIVASRAVIPSLSALAEEVPDLGVVYLIDDPEDDDLAVLDAARFSDLAAEDESDVWADSGDRDAVQCLYTSGTTAAPKGVLTSHLAVTFTSIAVAYDMHLTEDDVTLVPLPLNHVAALNAILTAHLLAGGAVHFMQAWDAARAAAEIERLGVTNMVLTGPMWTEVVTRAREDGRDISSLRRCIVGMANLAPDRAEQLRALAPKADITLASGMTEFTSWQVAVRPADQETKALSWGSPSLMTEVAVMDESGNLLGPNTPGEIVYRGPTAMNGYLNLEEEGEKLCDNGWFRSGDLGYLDEDHTLWFVDRLKDMIKTGGENVASIEVAEALFSHPEVLDCAVVGLPHERWSEAITAFVKVKDGSPVSGEGLIEHCRSRLSVYKVPKRVILVDEFPRTSSGKIQKAKLREEHADLYRGDAR